MSVIKTGRNFVCAYEPEPGDSLVVTYLFGEAPTGEGVGHELLTQPIDRYQEAVEWAVAIAEQMAWFIEVVTLTTAEYVNLKREQIERVVGALTDEERGGLRHIVQLMAEVIRDCDDANVRAEACDVLVKLRVVR